MEKPHREQSLLKQKQREIALELSGRAYINYDIAEGKSYFLFGWNGHRDDVSLGKSPETEIQLGLVAPESADTARAFFNEINSGRAKGKDILRLLNEKTGKYCWARASYKNVFDNEGKASYALIALENIGGASEGIFDFQSERVVANATSRVLYYELNLITGHCVYYYGRSSEGFKRDTREDWGKSLLLAVEKYAHPNDKEQLAETLQCNRLLQLFEQGTTESELDFRSTFFSTAQSWSKLTVSINRGGSEGQPVAHILLSDIQIEKEKRLHRAMEKKSQEEREQDLRDVIDGLNSAILCGICKFKMDECQTIIYANTIFYNAYGYGSKEEALAAGFDNYKFIVPPEERKVFINNIHSIVCCRGRRCHFVTRRRHPNGKYVWLRVNAAYSEKDKCVNLSLFDITEQKKLEEALKIKQKDYDAAASLSDQQVYIFDPYKKKLCPTMNKLEKQLKLSSYENVPESLIESGEVMPGDEWTYRSLCNQVTKGKPSGETYLRLYDRKNDARCWYHIKYRSIFDEAGQVIHAIASAKDVTEKREQELAYSMNRRSIERISAEEICYFEVNLNRERCEYKYGLVWQEYFPGENSSWDQIIESFANGDGVNKDYKQSFTKLFSMENICTAHKNGETPLSYEFLSRPSDGSEAWRRIEVDVLRDKYSKELRASCAVKLIDKDRAETLQNQRYIEELQEALASSRLKAAMAQMQPHFLYNALSSIRAIVRVDPSYAYDLIYDFATHLRGCIKAMSSDALVSFNDEMENIRAYLNIEQMRFGDKLRVVMDIKSDGFFVAPLSIQPVVENAVCHGIFERGRLGGTVTIKSYEIPGQDVIEVIDDGVGFDLEETLTSAGDSVGLKNMMFRCETLMKAKVNINSVINVGTTIQIIIPRGRRLP